MEIKRPTASISVAKMNSWDNWDISTTPIRATASTIGCSFYKAIPERLPPELDADALEIPCMLVVRLNRMLPLSVV